MSNVCGNNVKNVWVSGLINCYSLSTHSLYLRSFQAGAYGNLQLSLKQTKNNPQLFAQLKISVSYLLMRVLSTLSTPPTIITKKEFKEI